MSVSDLTSYLKQLIEGDVNLYNIWVRGEVTNFKQAYSGHCYFKLKDKSSIIPCVMFRSAARRVKFEITDGKTLSCRGNVAVYKRGGYYQLKVEEVKPGGMGEIFLKFLQLKEKLQKKGYFEQARKRTIPFIPRGIGIATSTKGAGLQDMIKIIHDNFPPAKIYVSPTTVQGAEAPASIINSIEVFNRFDPVDVIIVGRGGGSFEDLNCFNDEGVAEAIFRSKKPVISGVGHQTDMTISDMVADLRAETPTAAAAMVVPNLQDLQAKLEAMRNRLSKNLENSVKNRKLRLKALSPQKIYKIQEAKINSLIQDLDRLWETIIKAADDKISRLHLVLDNIGRHLKALGPFEVLKRGYTMVRDRETGKYLGKASEVNKEMDLTIVFWDGEIPARATGPATPGGDLD